jgi:pimeloyl-ACP methyl ester carboxylesterase
LSDVQLEVIQGCGHWVQLEKKEELLEILKKFASRF